MTNSARPRFAAAALLIVASSLACGGGGHGTPQSQRVRAEDRDLQWHLDRQRRCRIPFRRDQPGTASSRGLRSSDRQHADDGAVARILGDRDIALFQGTPTNASHSTQPYSGSPSGPDEYCVGILDIGNLQAPVESRLSSHTIERWFHFLLFTLLLFTFPYSPPGWNRCELA